MTHNCVYFENAVREFAAKREEREAEYQSERQNYDARCIVWNIAAMISKGIQYDETLNLCSVAAPSHHNLFWKKKNIICLVIISYSKVIGIDTAPTMGYRQQ